MRRRARRSKKALGAMDSGVDGDAICFRPNWHRPLLFLGFLWLLTAANHLRSVRDGAAPDLDQILIVVAALVSGFFVIQIVRGRPRLTISREGFEVFTGLSNKKLTWPDCEGYGIEDHGVFSFIVVAYSASYRGAGHRFLIMNLYDATSAEIYRTLCLWHKRHANCA
jgi:hypothetical protein